MAAKYTTMLASHPDLLPGEEDFIRALHGKVKMAIVSNGLSAIQRGRLGLCLLTPMFDAIVISEEVGVAKPDPKLIEVALGMLGCKDKSQAVMMGDSLSADIKAAVNAGVDSIFFSPKGSESDLPTYTVRNHAEALAILMEE
jgi:putative hydrolase of the HAD superfamily